MLSITPSTGYHPYFIDKLIYTSVHLSDTRFPSIYNGTYTYRAHGILPPHGYHPDPHSLVGTRKGYLITVNSTDHFVLKLSTECTLSQTTSLCSVVSPSELS